jgi:hypothetical protein
LKWFSSVLYFVYIILSTVLHLFILLIGGMKGDGRDSNDVELISLDLINNPVPDKFKALNEFPVDIYLGVGGAGLSSKGTVIVMYRSFSI